MKSKQDVGGTWNPLVFVHGWAGIYLMCQGKCRNTAEHVVSGEKEQTSRVSCTKENLEVGTNGRYQVGPS